MTEPDRSDDRPIDKRIMDIFEELTQSERRLAAVVLEAQSDLSSFTAGELAARADISNATAARFFRRLGYANYGDARRHARRGRGWGSPLEEWSEAKDGAADDFSRFVAGDIQNLTRSAELISEADIERAAALIAGARSVRVLGFRNSMVLASYARGLLIQLRPTVDLMPLAGMSLAEEMAGIAPEDVLVVFGFRRRPPLIREVMEVAREAGTPSVLIADLTAAEPARLATVALRCHNHGHGPFDSYVAPISLINHLATRVAARLGTAAETRLSGIEALHERLGTSVTPSSR